MLSAHHGWIHTQHGSRLDSRGRFGIYAFRQDGAWENNFDDNFWTNYAYVAKSWSDAVGMRAGIVPVHVGVTNVEGPALTIYDPVSETAIIPTGWDETGATFFGSHGKWSYSLSALAYLGKHSQMLGAAGHVGFAPTQGLSLGLGAYWGDTHRGQVGYEATYFERNSGAIVLAGLDAALERDGITASMSAIMGSIDDARTLGVEAGYNVLEHSNAPASMQLVPFARYDGTWNVGEDFDRYTLGVNFMPITGLSLKVQWAWHHHRDANTQRMLDLSVGYCWEF